MSPSSHSIQNWTSNSSLYYDSVSQIGNKRPFPLADPKLGVSPEVLCTLYIDTETCFVLAVSSQTRGRKEVVCNLSIRICRCLDMSMLGSAYMWNLLK